MNAVQRRLLKAFFDGGGALPDGDRTHGFLSLVRDGLLALTPTIRRAVEVTLEAGEEASYDVLAATLSLREGRQVAVEAVRQRVSRGTRQLERWIREEAQASDIGVAPAPVTATYGR